MDNDFLSDLVKKLDDEHTTIAAEGKSSAEFSGTIDTGSSTITTTGLITHGV